ncbi:siderophore-iron reductase FhuF [Siccibacter colletis]|uniref:siderophore-iron reductase FhuF n=1 Tax=Siccibacter colletis TaxID=1505757 RepID=UPI0028BF4990|nr:siderophore-iron reductase FhuF [Siccibacter colletis]WNN48023.1 siderophore-iron reductase FhuF [Siccibacter colletis]
MAYRITQIVDNLVWQPGIVAPQPGLSTILRELFTAQRPYFNDIIKLDEPSPRDVLTLSQWSRPATLTSLMASYSDHIYRNQPTLSRENKPLKSLWAQWYIGLMVPPVLLALLTQSQALDLAPEHFHVEFHETGRAACFWIDVHEDRDATPLTPRERVEKLVTDGIAPVIAALEASGDINGKLIWSNTGYLINWFLGEMKAVIGDETADALRHTCFFEKQLLNGDDNPLYRTVVLRDGLLVRRTCCQRYRLPDVVQCGDCTLK